MAKPATAKKETKAGDKPLFKMGNVYKFEDSWGDKINVVALRVKKDRILVIEEEEYNNDNDENDPSSAWWVDRQDLSKAPEVCKVCGK